MKRNKRLGEVVTQLAQWSALKTQMTMNIWGRFFLMSLAGELFQGEARDIFDFMTVSREILVPVVPTIYRSLAIERKQGHTIVTLKRFDGKISLTELDPEADLLSLARQGRGRVN